MTHKSPESTTHEKAGWFRRLVAGAMGICALSASGCGMPGLEAKPAPATVTVTTTNRHPQTTEAPQAPQTVRVTETVTETPSPSKSTSRPTETSRQQSTAKKGDIVTIGGQITCADGKEFVGAWVERANEEILKSDWVQTDPTSDPSIVNIKNLPVVIGDKIKVSVGCDGSKKDWGTVSYSGFTEFTGKDPDITCYPNGKNGWCEVTER